MRWLLLSGVWLLSPLWSVALDPAAVARGKKALEGTAFIAPSWRAPAWENLWKVWGLERKPDDFDRQAQSRYGLHPAPYPNDGLPMGLRPASFLFVKGVAIDCMLCHGGSLLGKSHVGLGNTSLDIESLLSEMNRSEGRSTSLPFTFCNVRGTTEAGGFAVYLLGFREPDLKLRQPRLELGLKDDLCEDVPAWWLLKKKKTMYFNGGADARSVRSKMQFMMSPLTSAGDFERHEPAFRDVQQYLLSMEAPRYPFPIAAGKAARGEKVFTQNCAKCHGTYGAEWAYPNKVIPLEEIGTDRKRFEGVGAAFEEYYNRSWFSREQPGWFFDGYKAKPTQGYQAPPLDGIWATAPYLHNASVPTLAQLLDSKTRPVRFTRSYETGEKEYDTARVGWRHQPLDGPAPASLPPAERRKIYDTTLPGRGNGGHTYGDDLTQEERGDLIEYLKTL